MESTEWRQRARRHEVSAEVRELESVGEPTLRPIGRALSAGALAVAAAPVAEAASPALSVGDRGERRATPRRRLPRGRGAHTLALVTADVVGIATAAILAAVLIGPRAALVTAAMTPTWLLVAAIYGLYSHGQDKAWHLTTDEVPRLVHWAAILAALTALILSSSHVHGVGAYGVLSIGAGAFAVSLAGRAIARFGLRHMVEPERTLIIGDEQTVEAVMRKLELERGHHVSVTASIIVQHWGSDAHVRSLRVALVEPPLDRVIIAARELSDASIEPLVSACRDREVRVSVASALHAVLNTGARLHHVAEVPFVEVASRPPTRVQLGLKRSLDVVGGTLLLLLAAPVIVGVAVAIRVGSPGPAFFRQPRAGKDGVPFTMLKFRTMITDAEARLADIVDLDALDEPVFKIRSDPRVTRVGRFLRATSLDELPQLVNVVVGHMSLVGPRPEELRVVERYDADQRRVRLGMKPGITGPMQIHGRGELTLAERIAVEREYVDHFSLNKDLKILGRTAGAVLFRAGAF